MVQSRDVMFGKLMMTMLKWLGCIFSSDLNMQNSILLTWLKVKRALFELWTMNCTRYLTYEMCFKIFDMKTKPTVYSYICLWNMWLSKVWHTWTNIIYKHLNILGITQHRPKAMVNGECVWDPNRHDLFVKCIKHAKLPSFPNLLIFLNSFLNKHLLKPCVKYTFNLRNWYSTMPNLIRKKNTLTCMCVT